MIEINIIIGSKFDTRLIDLNKYIKNSIVIYNYCKIKSYQGTCTLIIPYEIILNNGFVSNTEISLDELLLQLKVVKIIYGNLYNSDVMKRFSKEYHIKVEYLKF